MVKNSSKFFKKFVNKIRKKNRKKNRQKNSLKKIVKFVKNKETQGTPRNQLRISSSWFGPTVYKTGY